MYDIIEVGSTNTKAYHYADGIVETCGFDNIEFKKNYQINNSIITSDIDKLSNFIQKVFLDTRKVQIYGTSIFRQLTESERSDFVQKLSYRIEFDFFKVISANEENYFTSFGAIQGFNLDENICVFIGGGGSTEISLYNKKNLLEHKNTPIGVMDILKHFPTLSNDITELSINEVESYIYQKINLPKGKAKYLVLAGGDFLLRYQNAKYPIEKNYIFSSSKHPYLISYSENRAYEEIYYHTISLSKLKHTTPLTPNWWDGTRAMCAFTDVVAKHIKAEYIFPTRISMIYGIIADLENKKTFRGLTI